MTRVNVDRMRRYMARTTPDVRTWRLDERDLINAPDPEQPMRDLLDHWRARMKVKHPGAPAPEFTVWTNDLRTEYHVRGRMA